MLCEGAAAISDVILSLKTPHYSYELEVKIISRILWAQAVRSFSSRYWSFSAVSASRISRRSVSVPGITRSFPAAMHFAAGSLAKRIGFPEGTKLKSTVLELCYKDDALGDPMINDSHVFAMGLCTPEELETIKKYALKINEILTAFFAEVNIELIDFKLEFGRLSDGTIVLADEISPDTCRFWDSKTHEKLDKDRFRRDLGNVEGAYHEILHRLMGE